ncbi:MAG: amino acid ABC transporter permease [Anaeromyxobacteraceae bacterium]|nr:amino acid ABC transporter permease [Anaeromyxobacteraceae bacterium]
MNGLLAIWPKSWPRERRSSATIVLAAALLLAFLWSLGALVSLAPDPIGPAAEQFADGTRVTVELTLLSGLLGVIFGLLAALSKMARFAPLRWAADFYVWSVRGTPLLVQVFFTFFALPELVPGLQLSDFSSAVAALAINVGAYNAEAIRAGIQAVAKGQAEAARSLGLSPVQTFVHVVAPQGFKIALPPLVNNVVALLKDTSLAYGIGVVELANVGNRLQAATFLPVHTLVTTAVIYLILTTVLTQVSAAIELRLDVHQH